MTAFAAPKPVKWWIPLVLGVLAVIVGILFLTKPAVTSAAFVLALGLYWLVVGILDIVGIFVDRRAWGWKLFTGIVGLLAGALILSGYFMERHPLGTAFAVGASFTIVLGFLGVVYGILALIQALRGAGWFAAIMGVLALAFGVLLLFNPLAATLGLPFTLGILLIFFGILMVLNAFQLR